MYDSVGKSTFDRDFELIARLGTLVSFGQSSGVPEPVSLHRLSSKNIKLLRPSLYNYLATQAEMEHYTGLLLDMLKHETLHVNVWREYVLSAEGVQTAQRDLLSRRTTGKLLMRVLPSVEDS